MKLKLLVLFALAATIFYSCGSDKNPAGDVFNFNASMSATIEIDGNSKNWSAHIRNTNLIGGGFNIMGTSILGEAITITTFGHKVGIYKLNLHEHKGQMGGTYTKNNKNYFSKQGVVEITSVNTEKQRISGTFSFDAIVKNGVKIRVTNGKFTDLHYEGSSSPSTTEMTATVDTGASFNWEAKIRQTTMVGNKINIIGTSSEGQVITLTTYGNTPGTYNLSADSMSAKMGGSYGSRLSKKGTVNISSVDTTNREVSGAFNFETFTLAGKSVKVTNGIFTNLKYNKTK